MGYDANKEMPIMTKIRDDIRKMNDKNFIIKKIFEMEKELNFEADKKRLIWSEDKDDENEESERIISQKMEEPGVFEPTLSLKKVIQKN
jgi:hypothetical protein